MKDPYLSIVIPSYREAENLRRGVLDEVSSFLVKQKFSWEVIVSDDGSPDEQSRSLAKDFCSSHRNFRFLQNPHGGKHMAVWSGIKAAKGEIILFTDMDQSTPIDQVEKLLPMFDKGFDIVIGSRGTRREKFTPLRKIASAVFLNLRRPFLLPEIIDTQAGFKAFRRNVGLKIFPLLEVIKNQNDKAQGWKVTAWDVEFLVAAKKHGYKIVEVPILWQDRDTTKGKGRGLGKFVYESLDMLYQVFRVKLNELRGLYNPKQT